MENPNRFPRPAWLRNPIGKFFASLKLAVVLLSGVNALMWEYYTQSRMMAIVWLGIAVAFVIWIVDDVRR